MLPGCVVDLIHSQSLSRIPTRGEWKRFKEYTTRVISLQISKIKHWYGVPWSRSRAWVPVETIQLLWLESQRGGFWSGLRSLTCNVGWDFVPFISLLITPTIIDLELTLPRESNRLLRPTLSLLTHSCRQLQSLMMNIGTPDPLSGREMGRLISASQHTLRYINIRSFTPPDIFPVIFDLPNLRILTLHEPHLPDQISPKILPHLQAISFSGNHGPNLPQFFRGLSVPRLAEARVSRGGIIQLSTLLESLRGASTTIGTFYFSPVAALDHSSIVFLRSFTNLTSLTIGCVCEERQPSGPCGFQPTDENVLELAEALPHVRFLGLGSDCLGPRHVTFTSLVCLSRTCGNLESLSLRVDFTSIVEDPDPDQLNHRNPSQIGGNARPQGIMSKLEKFAIGNSPLPDTPRCEWVVALALVSIFPSIRWIFSYRTDSEEMCRKWGAVRENILVCQRILNIAQAAGKSGLNTSAW